MPWVQGETTRDRLNRETQFGLDEAVRIGREVADALDYAHWHRVIHRDIFVGDDFRKTDLQAALEPRSEPQEKIRARRSYWPPPVSPVSGAVVSATDRM